MKKHKKTLDNVEVGKSIEINGYDYQYVGKKVGKSCEIRGQECYVYVSHELKEKINLAKSGSFVIRPLHMN